MWIIVATQCKFVLAFLASTFGGCYPIMCVAILDSCHRDAPDSCHCRMVASVELFVIVQLMLLWSGTIYSSVLTMNAVRLGGLLCAAINGLYGLFVLIHFADHPAAQQACSTSPPLAAGSAGSGSDSDTALRLVNDYTTFFGLLAANVIGIACGALHLG